MADRALRATVVICTTAERADSLARTLAGLRWLAGPACEVVVARSGVAPGAAVPALPEDVRVVATAERNLSAARNLGIRAAAGDVIAFIDDDAVPEASWLSCLTDALAGDGVVAASGPVLDHTGVTYQVVYSACDADGDARALVDGPDPSLLLANPFTDLALYAIGTSCAFRRDALVRVGGFDEEFEYHLDETDVCRRLVLRGGIVRGLRAGHVHHGLLPNAQRRPSRAMDRRYTLVKNRTYFALRHGPLHRTPDEIERGIDAFIDLHRADTAHHIRLGNIDPSAAPAFEADALRGRADGTAAARRGPRVRTPAWLDGEPRPFQAYGTRRAAACRHIAVIAAAPADERAERRARALAASGEVVSLLAPADEDAAAFVDDVWRHGLAADDAAARLAAIDAREPVDAVELAGEIPSLATDRRAGPLR